MSSIHRASDIHSQISYTIQPQANLNLGSLEFHQSNPYREKSLYASLDNSHHYYRDLPSHCERGRLETSLDHSDCHKNWNIRLRGYILVPTIFVLVVTLGGLLAWRCHRAAWKVDLMRRDVRTVIVGTPGQFAPLTHDLFNPKLIIDVIPIVPSRSNRYPFAGLVAGLIIMALMVVFFVCGFYHKRKARKLERRQLEGQPYMKMIT
jgi:hypothetical protein